MHHQPEKLLTFVRHDGVTAASWWRLRCWPRSRGAVERWQWEVAILCSCAPTCFHAGGTRQDRPGGSMSFVLEKQEVDEFIIVDIAVFVCIQEFA